jgi:hypothetical protein
MTVFLHLFPRDSDFVLLQSEVFAEVILVFQSTYAGFYVIM